jgi:hypothetical protein
VSFIMACNVLSSFALLAMKSFLVWDICAEFLAVGISRRPLGRCHHASVSVNGTMRRQGDGLLQ